MDVSIDGQWVDDPPAPAFDGAVTAVPKPRKRKTPMKDVLKRFHCTACTKEIGFEQHQIVQVLRDPHEANGKLIAGSL